MRRYRFATPAALLLSLCLAPACESEDVRFEPVATADDASMFDSYSASRREFPTASASAGGGADDDTASASGPASSLPDSISVNSDGKLLCGNDLCACNNGLDDDGDGTVDGFDVECTGGLDDDESSFATGIPGDNRDPKWQDCFFDGNSGHGDDRCRFPTECLTGELAAEAPACAVTEQCRNNCLPLAPNGCDCFGCCSVPTDGGTVDVILSASCSVETLGDPEACAPCTKAVECENPCDRCELCAGKTVEDLPADCNQPPPVEQPPAEQPPPVDDDACDGNPTCSAEQPCVAGQFCSQGCCIAQVSVIR